MQISQSSTATLTKVAQPDGSITAVQYLSPVFHRESGRRVRNDARLAPSSDKVYPLQAQHALHPLHVGHRPDRLLSWDLAAGAVTVTVQGAQPVAADAADPRGRVRFPGALNDSDVLVSSTATGARMDLLLHSAASDRSMTLLVSDPGNALGGVGAATANGGWEFPAVQPGGGHITLDPPYAYHPTSSGGPDGPVDPRSARLTVSQQSSGVYALTESVDSTWLSTQTYPVELDPQIVDSGEGTLNDCQLFSGDYQYNSYCPSGMTYWTAASNVGYTARTLLRPDLGAIMGRAATVNNAYLGEYSYDEYGPNDPSTNNSDLQNLCAGGTFWGTGPDTTWANTAGGAPLGNYCTSFWSQRNNWVYPDVTSQVRAAQAGAFPYYGFVQLNADENCCYQYQYHNGSAATSSTPYFVVNYTTAPQAAPAPVALYAGDNTLTTQWNAPSDDGGSPVTNYNIYTTDTTTNQLVSGSYYYITGGTYSKTLTPADGIVNGHQYYSFVLPCNRFGCGPGAATGTVTVRVHCTQLGPTGYKTATNSGDTGAASAEPGTPLWALQYAISARAAFALPNDTLSIELAASDPTSTDTDLGTPLTASEQQQLSNETAASGQTDAVASAAAAAVPGAVGTVYFDYAKAGSMHVTVVSGTCVSDTALAAIQKASSATVVVEQAAQNATQPRLDDLQARLAADDDSLAAQGVLINRTALDPVADALVITLDPSSAANAQATLTATYGATGMVFTAPAVAPPLAASPRLNPPAGSRSRAGRTSQTVTNAAPRTSPPAPPPAPGT